jgi:hypothetical protein
MTPADLVTPDYSGPIGPYLCETLATEAGRKTVLYILLRLGYFSKTESAESQSARNAAIELLNDITAITGFSLDINLIH